MNLENKEQSNEKSLSDTVDAFIIGFDKGNDGTNIENLVGALHFGVYLLDENNEVITDENGNPKVHHIASISGITLKLREMLTEYSPNGEVLLKKEWYGQVAEIDGQDISSRNYRISHARFIRWRTDRSADSCTIKESFLKEMVM